MGMAASQARYLQITARKINTEYEGQQINQQRTMLANESAGLFAQLMALQVPTAPSTTNYTTTQYTFSDGANQYTITDINALDGDPNYNAQITYYHTEDIDTGILETRSDLGIRPSSVGPPVAGPFWLTDGVQDKVKLLNVPAEADDAEAYQADLAAVQQICDDNPTSHIAQDALWAPTDPGYVPANAGKVNPARLTTNIYKYKNTGNGKNYYIAGQDVIAAATNTPGTPTTLNFGYEANIPTKIFTYDKDAYLQTTDSGRYSDVTLEGYTKTFPLTATTTTDTAAYEDAMNEYQYQQNVYDKAVSDINAKTEIIEQEDKTLELKLARLDTEQQALQTELDAVKKVIDKNIEETFKTFS